MLGSVPPADPTTAIPLAARDPSLVNLYRYFYDELDRLTLFYVDMFVPIVDGERLPIFEERLDEFEEWFVLEEAQRKLLLVNAGMMEPDEDVLRFAQNEDGAVERLHELRSKYLGSLPDRGG